MKKAIVLLSGGMDSATTLYYAKSRGYECLCLAFDYGQRHKKELTFARKVAAKAGCRLQVAKINLPWKGSSLLDKSKIIPSGGGMRGSGEGTVPNTYVPGRNIIFLSFALSYAEAAHAQAIFIGANAIDYSGYPDCRPEFFSAFSKVINTGTKVGAQSSASGARKAGINIEVPLVHKSKKEIVKLAHRLKVPLEETWSCYRGAGKPCGRCDSCVLRARGFREAGLKDPAL